MQPFTVAVHAVGADELHNTPCHNKQHGKGYSQTVRLIGVRRLLDVTRSLLPAKEVTAQIKAASSAAHALSGYILIWLGAGSNVCVVVS